MTAPKKQAPFTQAKWIWSKGRSRKPFQVSYFRHGFQLANRPSSAKLYCCADSKYRLWVNGEYVGFGPARGHPQHPYYDTHDITRHLKAGKNTIAFLVQHYTDKTKAYIFAAVQGGLICQVNSAEQGVLAASDATWLATSSEAYDSLEGLHFPEIFDARKELVDWQRSDFDDRAWDNAQVLRSSRLASPEDMLPRPIPPLTDDLRRPKRILDMGICWDAETENLAEEKQVVKSLERMRLQPLPSYAHAPKRGKTGKDRIDARLRGLVSPLLKQLSPWQNKRLTFRAPGKGKAVYLLLDFGQNMLAAAEISLEGEAGTIVDIGYGEYLKGHDRIAPLLSDRIILRKGQTTHRMIQPRGFRFMIIRISNCRRKVAITNVCAYEQIYPAKRSGRFVCSDSRLNKIYDLCVRSTNLCMEDAYTDCCGRERCQWLGDFQPEALFSYYAFGAYDIARKAVWEFGHGNQPGGWIPGVYPISIPHNLPTWGMRYPVIAWEYYFHTGDRETLEEVYPGVKQQMEWLAQYETSDGYLSDEMPGWRFVDWTGTDSSQGDGAVQGWYLDALDHAARIATTLGDKAKVLLFERKAAKLRKSLARDYWSEERKAFLKYNPKLKRRPPNAAPDLVGQQENFQFALLKVGTAQMRRQALQAIAGDTGKYLPSMMTDGSRTDISCQHIIALGSTFWSFYGLLALLEAGQDQTALDYIRICWGMMLDWGETSCLEIWGREASHSHAWGAAPAMILPAYVLGIKPTKPGFARFEVRPRLADLAWAKGTVPTPQGKIGVEWRMEDGRTRKFHCQITVPKGTVARFAAPPGFCQAGTRSLRLEAGKHNLVFSEEVSK